MIDKKKIAAFISAVIFLYFLIGLVQTEGGTAARSIAELKLIAIFILLVAVWFLAMVNDRYKRMTGESFIKNRLLGRDQSSSIFQAYDKAKRDKKHTETSKRNRAKNPRSAHPQGVIFGLDDSDSDLWVYAPAHGLAAPHTFIYGPTGSGKTQAVILPSITSWPKEDHIFCIDVSGDIIKTIQENNWMRTNIKVIDFSTWKAPIRYDVFGPIRAIADDQNLPDDEIISRQERKIDQIAHCLIPDPKQGDSSNSYFVEGGRDLLTATLIAGFFNNRGFVETLRWLTESSHPIEEISESGIHSAVVLVNQFNGQNEKNVNGIRGEAIKAAEKIVKNSTFAKILTPKAESKIITPTEIEKYDIFIRINMNDITVISPIIGLLLRQMMDYILSRNLTIAEKHPILIVADELASYARYWSGLTNDVRNVRKFGGRMLMCVQDYGSLDAEIGRSQRETIVANCGYKCILGSYVPADQRDLSALVGKEEQKKRMQSYSPYHPSSFTDRWEMLPVIYPEDFGTLISKQQLVLLSPDGWELINTAPFWKVRDQLHEAVSNQFVWKNN